MERLHLNYTREIIHRLRLGQSDRAIDEGVSLKILGDDDILQLARWACLIEDHYGCHQDIEWAFEQGNLYVLQARRAKAGGE